MRAFFLIITITLLLAGHNFAQSEIAVKAFQSGVVAANQNKYEEALESFENALVKAKLSGALSAKLLAKINYNIGVCHYRLGRFDAAHKFLTAAIEISQNKNGLAARALGMVQIELGDWSAAETAFRAAIKMQNGRDGESWFDLGTVYLRQKDLRRAADCFEKAVFYKSVDAATAHNNLGVIAALANDWAKAKTEFQTALALSGGNLREAQLNLKICPDENSSQMLAWLKFTLNYQNKFTEEMKNER